MLNYRSKLLHNALCWATTGQIRGRVVDVNGCGRWPARWCGRSPNREHRMAPSPGRRLRMRTAAMSSGGWCRSRTTSVEASVPGFNSQHLQIPTRPWRRGIRGPRRPVVSAAAPGSISGTVKNSAGGPVPGAVVPAKLTAAAGYLGQVDFAASTNAQGQLPVRQPPGRQLHADHRPDLPRRAAATPRRRRRPSPRACRRPRTRRTRTSCWAVGRHAIRAMAAEAATRRRAPASRPSSRGW